MKRLETERTNELGELFFCAIYRWVDFLGCLHDVCRFEKNQEDEELMEIILTPLVGGSPSEEMTKLYLNVLRTMVEMDEVLHITIREGGAS